MREALLIRIERQVALVAYGIRDALPLELSLHNLRGKEREDALESPSHHEEHNHEEGEDGGPGGEQPLAILIVLRRLQLREAHEIEDLAASTARLAKSLGLSLIMSGQGYLVVVVLRVSPRNRICRYLRVTLSLIDSIVGLLLEGRVSIQRLGVYLVHLF